MSEKSMRNIERARSHMIILSPPSGKANNTLLSHLNGTIGNAKSTYQYQAASKKLANNATINRPSNNIYYSQTSPSNMGQKKSETQQSTAPILDQKEKNHSTIMWQILIPRASRRQHSPLTKQRYHVAIRKPHRRYNASD